MSIINIDRRTVAPINRNKRIVESSYSNSTSSGSSGASLIFKNGLIQADNSVTFSGLFDGNLKDDLGAYIPEVTAFEVDGNTIIKGNWADKVNIEDETIEAAYNSDSIALTVGGNVKIFGNLNVQGNISASQDVIAYFASATSNGVLDALSVSYPLEKTGTNVALKYNSAQFELIGNSLSIKTSILGGGGSSTIAGTSDFSTYFTGTKANGALSADTVSWSNISSKPTFAAVAYSNSYIDLTNKPTIYSTIASLTDVSSYFTGTKANTASIADAALSINWSLIASKPTFATVATSGSYTDLSNKPTIYSTIASLTDKATYFTGTKALTASVADSANAVTWTNVSGKPTFATVATTGSYTDLTNKPISTGTLNKVPKFNTTTTLADSNITDTGSLVTIGSNTTISGTLGTDYIEIKVSGVVKWKIYSYYDNLLFNNASGTTKFQIDQSGNAIFKGDVTAFG